MARQAFSAGEVLLVVLIFSGWFTLNATAAMTMGFPVDKFGDGDAIGLMLTEAICTAAAGTLLYRRGWRMKDCGLQINRQTSVWGVLIGLLALVANALFTPVATSLVGGEDFLNQLVQAITVSAPMAIGVSIINGIFEEFFLCRYLIEAFRRYGASIALGVSALVRIGYHVYQGPLGVAQILLFALVVTPFYWRTRQVWPLMLAHILIDCLALLVH